MADNKKIIISTGKDIKSKTNTQLQEASVDSSLHPAAGNEIKSQQEPLDENLWGNDYELNAKLDEEFKAEKRLFVRVRHMQQTVCKSICDGEDAEPETLREPIIFTIIDISVGGIGIICDYPINVATVLIFPLTLDNITYEIKCKVVYGIQIDGKYRIGLKLVKKEKEFIRHLKICVARLSLNDKYGS